MHKELRASNAKMGGKRINAAEAPAGEGQL